jgi:hypothetical protein
MQCVRQAVVPSTELITNVQPLISISTRVAIDVWNDSAQTAGDAWIDRERRDNNNGQGALTNTLAHPTPPNRAVFNILYQAAQGAHTPDFDRLMKNSFSCEAPNPVNFTHRVAWLRIWPDISLINHDCRPNAILCHNEQGVAEVIASTVIQAWEGVEINYIEIDWLKPVGIRRKILRQAWGFTCHCPHCADGTTTRDTRSELRARAKVLRRACSNLMANAGGNVNNLNELQAARGIGQVTEFATLVEQLLAKADKWIKA